MISASLDSTKTPLQELLARADKGSLQLAAGSNRQIGGRPPSHCLTAVEKAVGQTVTRDPTSFRRGAEVETCDEGPEEWDAEEPLEEAAS